MDLEDIRLCEINLDTDKYYKFFLICGSSRRSQLKNLEWSLLGTEWGVGVGVAKVEEGRMDMINAHCMHVWKYHTEFH
jgi:hypothetical protein